MRGCRRKQSAGSSPGGWGARRAAPPFQPGTTLDPQPDAGGHHRRSPHMNRGDDLLGVDSLQVDARRAEVGMTELALDVERNALAGELERVRVAELMRCEAPPGCASAASRRSSTRTPAADQGRPRVGPSITQKSGPTGSLARSESQGRSCSKPDSSMSTSRRRPPLPRRTRIERRPGSRSRSLSARPLGSEGLHAKGRRSTRAGPAP